MAPIHIAARRCDVEAIRRELQRGVDPNLTEGTSVNKTPLQLIQIPLPHEGRQANVKALNCFRLLLENGASVDVRSSINDTVLHDASLANNPAIVALLLEFGADVHARNNKRDTPLHRTAFLGRAESARLLLKAGAAVNARNVLGRTPLQEALYGGMGWNNHLICPVFLRAGASLPTDPYHGDPYIQRVVDAGGIANYERGHLASRVATFTPKLAHLLPPELVRRVVAFWMHAGDY